jgi:serine/threonine protein kinase
MLASLPEDRPRNAAEALAALTSPPAPVPEADALPAATAATVIGPWVVGAQVESDRNWSTFAVTHARTGAPARLAKLRPPGLLAGSSDLILASAERASRLDHPAILPVIDWGVKDELAYVVTRPHGPTLEMLVRSGGPLEEPEALELLAALADALAFLHGRGLVFQVLNPGAAHIGPDGRSVHLGWPLFCVEAGTPVVAVDGKRQRVWIPQWAAPEAPRKEGFILPSIDIYGLGEILYYVLAGAPAYGEPSPAADQGSDSWGALRPQEILLAKLEKPRNLRERRPDLTGPTARLASELLNLDPAGRPASAAAVRDELLSIARRLRAVG